MRYLAFMNTRLALLLIILCVAAALSSCGNCSKKVDCPGYNDSLWKHYFPYADNQVLRFVAGTELMTVTLRDHETTQPYQATSGVFGPSPGCEAHKTFLSLEQDSAALARFRLTLDNYPDLSSANLYLGRQYAAFFAQSDTAFRRIEINGYPALISRRASLNLGNRTFTNITVAERDTTGTKITGLYAVYHTKSEGIVAYTEYPSLKTWVKQ